MIRGRGRNEPVPLIPMPTATRLLPQPSSADAPKARRIFLAETSTSCSILRSLFSLSLERGGREVTRRHNEWSEESNRPMRSLKSLEHKFKTLVAMKKPTGDGHCPPDVKRAKRIDCMITERAGTRDIDDSDLDDGDDDDDGGVSSDDSVKIVKPTAPVHTAVACRAPSLNAPDLVNKLAKVFDPETQQSLQEERSQRSFQNTQLFTLMQQLRDAQAANDNLRYQVTTAQNQAHESDRARDRAEFKLQMYEHGAFGGSGDGDDGKGKRRSRFQCTGDNGGDSDKENWNPSSSSRPSSFPRSSSPSDFTASFDTSSGADGSAMVAGPSSSGVGSSATNNARAYSVEI
ncbi:hypothetical protein MVEN_01881100 [Mycena venus]|uniref:DUF6818 domain-containing protein n=1 Tax=Mycena venus TaxID=2733690 RepID=A0A8H7CKY7_9AGAR|nr:hypothetical protein MVEN_01881100 [Mycena venus]